MPNQCEVLVAIVNRPEDFVSARDEHWYRIPVASREKWLRERWPPEYLALYQTNKFGAQAHAIHWFAKVCGISTAVRSELFPNEPRSEKSNKRYFRLELAPLQRVTIPIVSRNKRKIVFISTTWSKFTSAQEINELFDDSPLENRLWELFKDRKIPAERQYFLEIDSEHYALDFAIWCERGKIDVEADGDGWHANPDKAALDKCRDHALIAQGWSVLRFTTPQVMDGLDSCSFPRICEVINELGGLDEGRVVPRKMESHPLRLRQKGLFDGTS